MVAATLCTHHQVEDGMKHLKNFVKEYYEREEETSHVDMSSGGGCVNEYDVPTNPDRTCRDSPAARADKEMNQFFANNNSRFLPKMKAHRTLGAVDERGQPRQPVYELGPVLEKGDDFYVSGNTRLNHANYMDRKGYFDLCQFYEDTKFLYPGLAYTFLGKIGHHSCQEADCETLFSMSGYKSDPRRLMAFIRTYERLVIASHRMHRFHIRDKVIIQEYLKRYKNKDWDEEECRDDEEFLKVEEELWAKMYPGQAAALAEENEVGDEVTSDSADEGDNLCNFFDDHDNASVMALPLPRTELGEDMQGGDIV